MSARRNSDVEIDSAIRVVVTPSQSSYFAGEPFSVTITFTNTRTAGSSRPSGHTHKRGAHSISSAPIARPPTSPGLSRSPAPATIHRAASIDKSVPTRKGFIGVGLGSGNGNERRVNGLSDLLEQKRQMLLAKTRSLSVDISHPDSINSPRDDLPSSAQLQDESRDNNTITAHAPVSSPLPRTPSFSIPSKHPHARKQSVFDGQIQLQDTQLPLSPHHPPSASTSAFSLTLDPIEETPSVNYPATPVPPTPAPLSDSSDTQLASKRDSRAHPPRLANGSAPRTSGQSGLGHGPPPVSSPSEAHPPIRSAFSSSFPQQNTEILLYSYAQLTGTLTILPLPEVNMSPEHLQNLNDLRLNLSKRSVVGGGSMDINSSLHSPPPQLRRRSSHNRSSSLSSGLFSLLTPSSYLSPSPSQALQPSQSWSSPSHHSRTRSQSMFAGFLPVPPSPNGVFRGGVGLGIVNGGADEEIDPETPLPTFEVQPAMLAVDLSLAPGESRSYTYTINLPDNLPPTFKGRSLRFSYELAVGICRAGSSPMRSTSSLGPTGVNSISRVMKVPIRVYNTVAVGKPQTSYDLLWPYTKRKDARAFASPRVTEDITKIGNGLIKFPTISTPQGSKTGSRDDLRLYGQRLLEAFPDPDAKGVRIKLPADSIPVSLTELERDVEREGDGAMTGCREAIEILTRNHKKVSYDVSKDGVKVAVLTFTKSAYRLGETVLGVVELNEWAGKARVLSFSAMLEAHESLPSSISSAGNVRHMRRIHAEHYSSFVSSTLRTGFSLDIPSDASPAFRVNIGGNDDVEGGLQWKVRLCLLVAVAGESSQVASNGLMLKHLVRDEPKGDWGTFWKASTTIAPMECPKVGVDGAKQPPTTWTQYFVSSFLGTGEKAYHDGDEDEESDDLWAKARAPEAEDLWKEVKVETVECELPISVWPANTAFKPTDVVFDV